MHPAVKRYKGKVKGIYSGDGAWCYILYFSERYNEVPFVENELKPL